MKILTWYIDLYDIENTKTLNTYPTSTKKNEIITMDTQMVKKKRKKNDTSSTPALTSVLLKYL